NVSRFDIPKALGDESLTVARVAYGTHTRKKTPYADIGINNLSAHLIAWNRAYIFYSSVGVRIKGRKLKGRRRRRWRNDRMWFASLDYSAQVRLRSPGLTGGNLLLSGSRSATHRKRVTRVINFAVGIGLRHDVDFIDCRFEYHDDGHPQRMWQERWD
ncbi:MAG: hypothetical protein F6K62_22275, partial [Sphaerospermopsis sp. SIO1G2]|nr:hypothetical protein [Sphaerospermopsis sp. SIO1G2]